MNTPIDLYIYLSSQTSTQSYPDNEATRFIVTLPHSINTEQCAWYMALLDIDLPKLKENYKPDFLMLSSSVCAPSFYDNSLCPVLQRFYFGELKSGKPLRFERPRYVRVNSQVINSLQFYITDDQGNRASFKPGQVTCTLHLRKETVQRLQ